MDPTCTAKCEVRDENERLREAVRPFDEFGWAIKELQSIHDKTCCSNADPEPLANHLDAIEGLLCQFTEFDVDALAAAMRGR